MSDNILVGIRVRPLINRETQDASTQIHWAVGEENKLAQVNPVTKKPVPTATPYKFDRVFGDNYNNEDIYMDVAEPILESALAGFNGTIFAYGQTSSGKTFTMMGDRSAPGVIPLAINHIFRYIEDTPDREFLIRVSFMEIYNENITDLLATGIARTKGLSVREDASGQVYVADLKEEVCNNEEMLLTLMDKGNKNRTVGQTNMNDRSSRSHTIFRIILESRERSDTDHTEEAVTVSHLNLVDLAGSENASQTGATGQRLKEGGFINSSLFMLGRVISQLSDGDAFINYRDSKLTRILQSSLGGNAKTAIICTVTPASVEQTHSTLRFASRAKSIKNHAVVNEVLNDAALLKRYAKEIAALKKMLENERNTDKAQEVEQKAQEVEQKAQEVEQKTQEVEQVKEKNQELISKNQELITKIASMKERLVVSSHLPSKEVVDKRRKLRRETWAAPAQRKAMRMSCVAPLKIDPFGAEFNKPELPPWSRGSNTSRGSVSSPPHSSSTPLFNSPPSELFNCSNLNSSSASMGFGQDVDGVLDMAEESILARHEQDDTIDIQLVVPPKTKRTRRVKFDTGTPPKSYSNVECQTEDTFLRNLSVTTPSRGFGTPFSAAGTPRVVLRERYKKMQEECEEKDDWLNDWKGELDELSEFQKFELQMKEESFIGKLEVGIVDEDTVEELGKEISSLKKSLMDSERLLLDSNKGLSQRNQEVVTLNNQLEDLIKDHIAADTLKEELDIIKNENTFLKRETDDQKQQISLLQNERNDFDMMMELGSEKQKRVERDLRRSLDDAWEEIANLEGDSKDAVRQRSERISTMEAELHSLRETNSGNDMEKQLIDMKSHLEDTESKYQNALKDLQAQNEKLEELQKLVSCMAELEAKVSEIEHLETQVNQSLLEKQQLSNENVHLMKENDQLNAQVNKSCEESQELRMTINSLQTELDHKALLEPTEEGTPEAYQTKITELQEEVDYLRMKLDESCFSVPRALSFSPCPPRLLSASSRSNLSIVPPSELSRKLSETIHVLEESLLSPITITPTKNSVSSMDDQFLDPQELHTIKDQLIALQSALMSQEFDLQLQMDSYKYELEYHNEVILNNETDNLLWEMQDLFNTEYYTTFITNSGNTLKQIMEQQHMNTSQKYESTACLQKTNCGINESIDNSSFAFGFEKKSSKVCYVAPMSANLTLNDTFETSILNLGTDYKTENIELKHQLEILNSENVTMFEKINVLEKKNSEMCEKKLVEAVKEKSKIEKENLEEEKFKIEKEKDNLEITLTNMKTAYEDLKKTNSTPHGNMISNIGKCNIFKEGKLLKNSFNSMSPMSLAGELQASPDDMVMDSTLDNSSVSQESDSKYSTVSMDMTLVRKTSESSPGCTQNSITYSPGEMDATNGNRDPTGNTDSSPGCRQNSSTSLGEMDVTNLYMDPAVNISTKNDSDNMEKFSKLEQKVELLRKENSALKEKIKEMIDEENNKVIQNLKCEVKEVCEEKVKLEKVKEEVYNSQSYRENENMEESISKASRVQEAELQLAENEEEMKKLRCTVQELLSVIESQKSLTNDDVIDSITNESFAPDTIANELQAISGNSLDFDSNISISLNKVNLTRKSLAPMSLADELRGLDVSINETFDTSILPNTSISHSTKHKISISPMSLANELKAMESSINETHESSTVNLGSNMNEESKDLNNKIQRLENENQELKNKLSCLQEADDNPTVNISMQDSDANFEKLSQLEQKVEVLMTENLSLKENIKEQLDEEKYNEIQDLKCKVKEVCDEKLKLEEEKENLKIDLANSRSTSDELNREVDNIQSDRANEDLEKSMSKANRVQELELQLTEKEIEMKKLEVKVQELVSEIKLLRNKTKVDFTNCVTNVSNSPDNIGQEMPATYTDQSDNESNLSMSINKVCIQRKSLAPMSLADELWGLDVSRNETIDTSVLTNLSFSQSDKQRISIAPMSLADELNAMEVSINETFESSVMNLCPNTAEENRELKEKIHRLEKEIQDFKSELSCLQEAEDKPIENISTKNYDSYLEKLSELEQKIEVLTSENLSLKENIKELLDDEKYKEIQDHKWIQDLKCKVKEVCDEKLKLEEEKENLKIELANSRTLFDDLKEEVDNCKSDRANEILDKSISKATRVQELESQLTENETDMEKLEGRVQELVSEIDVLKSKTKNNGGNSSINESFAPDSIANELKATNGNISVINLNVSIPLSKVRIPRKSLVPITLADELRGLDVSINETFDTSVFSNTSFSHNNIQRKSIVPMSIADELMAMEGSINETFEMSVISNSSTNHRRKSQKSFAPIVLVDELRAMECSIDETFESSTVNLGSNIDEESKKLREKIHILEKENHELKDQVSNLQEAADNYCLQTDVIADKLELEKELDEIKSQLVDSDNKSVDNAELQIKMEKLMKEKLLLEEELEEYKMVNSRENCKEIEELKTKMDEICEEKCVLEEEKINLEKSIIKSRAVFSDIQSKEPTLESESKKNEMEERLLCEESKVSGLEVKLDEVEKEKGRLEKVVEEQTIRIDSLKTRRERRVGNCKARRTSRLSVAPMSLADELRENGRDLTINDISNTSTLDQDNTSTIIDELRNVSLDSEAFRTCIEEPKTRLSVGHVSFDNTTMDESSQENTIYADEHLETTINCENQLEENKALKEQMNNLKASISKLELEKNLLERRLSESRIAYEDLQSLRWQVDSLTGEKKGLELSVKEARNHIQKLEISVKLSDTEIKILEVKLKEIEEEKEPKKDELSESKQDSGVNSVNETFESCAASDVMELKSPEKYKLEKKLQLVSNKLADANLQFVTIEELEAQMKLFVNEREMLLSKLNSQEKIQGENNSLLEKVRQLEYEKLNSNNYEKEVKNFSIQTFEDNEKSNDIELEIKLLKEKLHASENDKECLKSRLEELTANENEKDLKIEKELSFIDSSNSLHNELNEITVGLTFNETLEADEISTSIAPLSLADELRGLDVEINETLDKSKIGREYSDDSLASVSFANEMHSVNETIDNFESTSLCELKKENKELKQKINTILAEKFNLVENFEYEVKTLREKLTKSEIKTIEMQRNTEEVNSHLTSPVEKETGDYLSDKAISSGIELVNESLDISMEENTTTVGSNKDSDSNALPSLADELCGINTTFNEVINTTLPSRNDRFSLASTEKFPGVNQTASESASSIAIIDENNQLKQRLNCLALENEQLVEKIDNLQKIVSTDNKYEIADSESVEANSLRQTVNNLEAQVTFITGEKYEMETKIVEREHLHSENEKLVAQIKLLESNSQEDDLEEMVMRVTEKEEQLDLKIGEMKEAMEGKENSLIHIRKDLDENLQANEELTKLTETLRKEKEASDVIISELKKDLDEIHELVKDKENVILQLKQQIKEATDEIGTLKPVEHDILQREIDTSKQGDDVDNYPEEVNEKLKLALSQVTEANNSLNSKDKELEKLQTEQGSLIKQMEELSNSLNSNEIEYTKLLEERTSLQNQLRENNLEFDNKLETKRKDLEAAEEQIETLKITIFDTENKITMKESELEETKASLEKVIAAHTIELEEMLQKLKEIETPKSDNIETQDIINQRMGELKELEDKHETILKEHQDLQIAYDNLKTILSSKTDELKNVTDEKEKQVETLHELVQQKDTEIAIFEEKASKTSESLSVLQTEIEAKNHRISNMETEVDEYKRKATEKEKEYQLLVETSKTSNDLKILELQTENERIAKLHQEVCQDNENITQLIQSNKGEIKQHLESIGSMEKELSVVVLERNELERIKEELDSQLKLKGKENEDLSRDLKDAKIQIDDIKITITGKDVELAQISNELIQLQGKIEELEVSKAESEEKLSSLSGDLELKQNSLKMKENETIILQKEQSEILSRLEKSMETADLKEKEIKDLNIRYDKSEEKLKNLEDVLEIKEKEESKGTSQRSELQAELDELKENLNLKDQEISKVQLECLSFKEQLDASENTIKEKVEEVLKLSSELNVLKDDHGNLELMQNSLKMKENETIILQKEQSEISSRLEKMIETADLRENEINDLNIRYVKSEENLKNLEDHIEIKEKEASQVISERIELQTELDDFKKNLKMKEDEVSKVQLECLSFKEQLDVSENTIKEKVEEVLKLSSELNVLKDDHRNLELTLKDKNEEVTLHEANDKSIKQAHIGITDKIADLEKDLDKKEDEIKNHLSVKKTLEMKCEENEKTVVLVQEKLKTVALEKEELLSRVSELESNFHAKEDELDNVVVEANEMATAIENMQEKITELEGSVATLEEDVNERSEKLSSAEFEKQIMEEQLSKNGEAWTKEEEKLVGVIEKYEVEVSEKASQIEKHETEISEKDSLIEKLNEEKTKSIQETDQKMTIFIKEKEEHSEEIKTLNSKYIRLQEQQQDNDSEKQVDDESKQNYEFDISKYRNKNVELNNKLENLESQLKEVKLSLSEKEEECDKLNLEIEDVMEHFKKQLKLYAEMYNEENKKYTEVKEELSSTQKKLTDREVEVSKLMKEKQSYDRENELLKENNQRISNEKMALVGKVNVCEKELEKKSGQFDALADECSDWKQQYSKLFEEKEEINKKSIASVKELKHLKENKGVDSHNVSDIEDIKKQLSITKSEKDSAEKKLKQLDGNYDLLERDYNQLREDNDALEEKGIDFDSFTLLKTKCVNLEKELHSLKEPKPSLGSSQLSSGENEDMKNKLCIIKSEKETVEKKLKQIDENYDLLESDYLQLREDCDALDEHGINLQTFTEIKKKCERLEKELENLKDAKTGLVSSEISGGTMEAINLLKRQNQSLKVENDKLKKQQKESINKSRESLGADDSLKEKLLSVERKNNELNMKLKALDAPSKKEVLRLTEELRISNLKMNNMRGELRRVQNTKTLDSTICDFQVKKMMKSEAEESPGAAAAPMDFSTGSSIVQEVQVIALENKVYHLERDMKKLKEENSAMEQHVDHYKAKAQEWRDKATKFNHYSEKHKKDVDSLRKDNAQIRTKLEETNAKIESQRFDLGHKREVIEKLEKEKKEFINKYSRSANLEPVSMCHSQLPTVKESETKLRDGTETQSSSGAAARGVSRRTSVLNAAPLPSQTRIERLPGAGFGTEVKQEADGDKVPMWQMLGKENKDYSKYRQSTGSRRKSEEDCKQQ